MKKEYEIIVETQTTVYVTANYESNARRLAVQEAMTLKPDEIRTKIVDCEEC